MILNQSYFEFNPSAIYSRERGFELHKKSLNDIKNRKNKFFSELHINSKKEQKILNDSIEVMHQMKEKVRKFKEEQLKKENDLIVKRVNQQTSFIDVKDLDKEYKIHKKLIKNIKKIKRVKIIPQKFSESKLVSLPPINRMKFQYFKLIQPFEKLDEKSRQMNFNTSYDL